jgi:LacI family transcriptional regulator
LPLVYLGQHALPRLALTHRARQRRWSVIGFRSNLRTNFPSVQITYVVKGEDSAEQTYSAVRGLLEAHPDISALYNVAGGNEGLVRALQEIGRAGDIIVVTHESNHVTSPLARDGLIHYLIAQNPFDLVRRVDDLLAQLYVDRAKEINLVDFAVYTRFNLPKWEATA